MVILGCEIFLFKDTRTGWPTLLLYVKTVLTVDLAVYSLAMLTSLAKTGVGRFSFYTHELLCSVLFDELIQRGLGITTNLPNKLVLTWLAVLVGVAWLIHVYLACQPCTSREFLLNRKPQYFRVSCYLLVNILAALELPPTTRLLAVLFTLFAYNAIHLFCKLFAFEYADLSV